MKEEEIVEELLKNPPHNFEELANLKRKLAKKYGVPSPSNIALFKAYQNLLSKKRLKPSPHLRELLKTRPIRSLSGVVNISVLTKPYPCPGKCIYCPIEKGIPKSYVSGEPAVERAKALNYHPYLQVRRRIEMLRLEGHFTDKIELRIVGGTFSSYPKKYQLWFVNECFRACNDYEKRKYSPLSIYKVTLQNLKREEKRQEKVKQKIVALSIETRPDLINEEEIRWLRALGVTLVEIGVQTIYDDILKLNLRGHTVKETILATQLLKDAGFKVLYQVMPNLLGSNLKKDEKLFEELFKKEDFQPDYLKIYPLALLKETPLYKIYLEGKYTPYSEKELIELLKKIKQKIPFYVRIQRIVRDIPSERVLDGGAKISNLRQIIEKEMRKENLKCKCIRCREVRKNYDPKEKIYLFREDYPASKGREIFLSYENKERTKLFSLLRLRIPSFLFEKNSFPIFKVLKESSIIREVKTFGELVPLKERKRGVQHKGLGEKLIGEAERITKEEFNLKKIAVISAVGVRGYFRKLGYKLRETYMVKSLSS